MVEKNDDTVITQDGNYLSFFSGSQCCNSYFSCTE